MKLMGDTGRENDVVLSKFYVFVETLLGVCFSS